MPPSAAKDAPVGGLRAAYARATAHRRCALPYHMPNKCLRLIDCAPILAHSRVLGAQLDQSASGQQRMHADYTETLGWNTCTKSNIRLSATFHRRAPRVASCEALLAAPAAPRWVGRCEPAASGARGVREALERPARNLILLSADSGRATDQELPLRTIQKPIRAVAWVWNDCTHRFPPSSERQFVILARIPSFFYFQARYNNNCLRT